MLAALVAQVVGDLRRALHDGGAAGILAVERAQRVDLGTAVALVAQLVRMRGHVRSHGLPIRGTARIAAHRVHQKTRGFRGNADGREEAHEHDDALGVHARLLSAQALDAHLVELALATLLRALGAKHRARVHELGGRGPLRHQIVLHHSAHDAGGALGAQAQAALRLHGAAAKKRGQVLAGNGREHLLRHDVGGLADAAHEQLRLLEQRRLDGRVTVAAAHVRGGRLEMSPERRLVGEQVFRSFGSLQSHSSVLRRIVSCRNEGSCYCSAA